jgi:hypothetical protein
MLSSLLPCAGSWSSQCLPRSPCRQWPAGRSGWPSDWGRGWAGHWQRRSALHRPPGQCRRPLWHLRRCPPASGVGHTRQTGPNRRRASEHARRRGAAPVQRPSSVARCAGFGSQPARFCAWPIAACVPGAIRWGRLPSVRRGLPWRASERSGLGCRTGTCSPRRRAVPPAVLATWWVRCSRRGAREPSRSAGASGVMGSRGSWWSSSPTSGRSGGAGQAYANRRPLPAPCGSRSRPEFARRAGSGSASNSAAADGPVTPSPAKQGTGASPSCVNAHPRKKLGRACAIRHATKARN